MRSVAFATHAGVATLAEDDRLLVAPLERRGLRVRPLVWDRDALLDDCAGVVFRSCWDYHEKQDAFASWVDALAQSAVPCCNSIPLVRWNMHKRYLLDLEGRGVRLPKTLLVAREDRRSLEELLRALGSDEAIVKPAVSMLADRTFRLASSRLSEGEVLLARARERGEVLLQHFVPEIETAGEISLVFFAGHFSHAVRKRPAPGDFRSQTEHGGNHSPAIAAAKTLRQAQRVLTALPEVPTFARVDGIEAEGELLLMELELIDPTLFLSSHPQAPERCADVLAARLGHH